MSALLRLGGPAGLLHHSQGAPGLQQEQPARWVGDRRRNELAPRDLDSGRSGSANALRGTPRGMRPKQGRGAPVRAPGAPRRGGREQPSSPCAKSGKQTQQDSAGRSTAFRFSKTLLERGVSTGEAPTSGQQQRPVQTQRQKGGTFGGPEDSSSRGASGVHRKAPAARPRVTGPGSRAFLKRQRTEKISRRPARYAGLTAGRYLQLGPGPPRARYLAPRAPNRSPEG